MSNNSNIQHRCFRNTNNAKMKYAKKERKKSYLIIKGLLKSVYISTIKANVSSSALKNEDQLNKVITEYTQKNIREKAGFYLLSIS